MVATDRPSFGPALRAFRLAHDLTPEQLARKAKLTAQHITSLEAGRYHPQIEAILVGRITMALLEGEQ